MAHVFVPPGQQPRLAILFMVLATVFLAGTTLAAKSLGTDALGDPLHPVQVTWGRFVFALLGLSVLAALRPPRFGRVHWGLHLGRTACGGTGVTLMFAAVAMIPLADATAISFLNPVFAMLLAIPLLGERVGPWRWLAAAVSLAGAAILLRPGGGALEPGALLALGAAMVLGLEITLIKRLSGREAPLQLLLVNNLIGVTLFSIAVLWVWAPPSAAQWPALVAVGLMMACAQACFIAALARADASAVVPITYGTLVFAAAYDFALFGVVPDAVSVAGAATILAGAALLTWRETRARS
ncbi:DMT family transporter [Rhodobacteraceae bacterium CCMM004]|nr:DMT family transporter [Rhodobacteraceae bacterium CCMM004]